MAKTKISEFDATAANNTDINSVNIAEGCAPSGINNAIRETMAALKRFQTGADGDSLTVGGSLVVSGSATLATTAISSADINAGTIDGTTIGGSTPAAGTFTTLASTGNTTIGDASGDSVTINAATVSTPNGLNFDSNTFVIDATNNRVGIGTSSPSGRLDISGANSRTRWDLSATTVVQTTTNPAANAYAVQRYDADSYQFYTTGSEKMRIDSSGNVGIGTSSPESKFHVVGSEIRLTGSNSKTSINLRSSSGAASWIHFTEVSVADKYLIGHPAGSADLVFRSNSYDFSSGTERMRIDSSGNVGIGTSSPSSTAKLTLTDAGSSGAVARVQFNSSTAGVTNGTRIGFTALTFQPDFEIWNGDAGIVRIATNNTERMRIDSSGNLLVGTTSQVQSGKFCVSAPLSSYNTITLQNTTTQAAGQKFMAFMNSSTAFAGSIDHTGTTTVAYTTSSDYRMKENVKPMIGALDKVSALKPCTYTWKQEFGGQNGQGFIAHELQAVVPDCVTGEKDAVDADGNPVYQGVDTSFLVATLTAAIQEQQAIIESLKSRLDAAGL